MPLAFVNYALAYLDRVNFGYAQRGGAMSATLHLSPNMGPFLSSSFFIGYCLLQIPSAMFAAKRQKVKWFIFWALLLWGCLSGLTGIITSVPLLIALRISLGAVEGIVLPVMLIYLTKWFTRPERSRSNAILMLANPVTMTVASAVCLTLITYFNSHRIGGFEGWQMMFIIEGLPSIVWAFIWLRLADETPADARWMTPREATTVVAMLDKEQRTIPKMGNFWTAFLNPSVLLIAGMFMCLNAASYGMSMWLPVIVEKGALLVYHSPAAVSWGLTLAATAGLLTTVPYFISIFTSLGVAWMSDRSLRRKRYVVGSMFVGSAAYILAYIAVAHVHAELESFLIAFLGLIVAGSCIYTPTAPNWAWLAEILPRNVVGESMALVNTFGALGGLLGTNLVGMLVAHLHSNNAAFVFLACAFGMAGVLGSLVRSVPRPEQRGLEGIATAAIAGKA